MSIDPQKSSQISHYLGIDYGAADVGLALADVETKMAFAYKTLKNDKNFLQNLAEIIERENVKTVVIGIPSYINRKKIEYDGEKLGKLLEEKLKVEVEYQNEMFTTKLAQHYLIERGVKGIKKLDDQEAARIILQEWLDRN
jgi:putative holliday junction resolvase